MEPIGPQYTKGYSEYDKRDVQVFYGKDGSGPLYQREDWVKNHEPELSPLTWMMGLGFLGGLGKRVSSAPAGY